MQPFGHSREFISFSLSLSLLLPQGRRPLPRFWFFWCPYLATRPSQPNSSLVSLKLHFSLYFPPPISNCDLFLSLLKLWPFWDEAPHMDGRQHAPVETTQSRSNKGEVASQSLGSHQLWWLTAHVGDHGGATTKRRLRPPLLLFQGPQKFLSTSSL